MIIRVGKLVIGFKWYKITNDDDIRKNAEKFILEQSMISKDNNFTGMSLHYEPKIKRKDRIERGTMYI